MDRLVTWPADTAQESRVGPLTADIGSVVYLGRDPAAVTSVPVAFQHDGSGGKPFWRPQETFVGLMPAVARSHLILQ